MTTKTTIDHIWTPASPEAEKRIIGIILQDSKNTMPEISQTLIPEDFLIPEYRNAYSKALELFTESKIIDPVTLLNRLNDDAYKAILLDCAQSTPLTSGFREYAKIVKQAAIRHRAYEKTLGLSEALRVGDDLETCQVEAVKLCESLNTTAKSKVITAKEGFMRFIADKQKPRSYYRTGFSKLDAHTYIDKGDYIIVGGRPSSGKTALTLQMALSMSERYRVAYFSLETSGDKIYDRLIANYTKTPLSKIKRGGIKNNEWGNIPCAADPFTKLNFAVVEAAGWSVGQIQAKAVQLGAEIIFIDYLGLISSSGNSRYEKITNISVDLHTLAQSRKITVIALSQLNREGKGEPDMTHLRESGQIEQDADIILLLHEENEQRRKLIVAKNKEGRTNALPFSFEGKYQRFMEIDSFHERR